MHSRPPRKQRADQGQTRKQVRTAVADMPDRLLSQGLGSPGRKENGSRDNRDTVGSRLPSHDVFYRSTGPERAHDPADEPGNPDKRQQLGGPGSDPPAPNESQKLMRIMQHS